MHAIKKRFRRVSKYLRLTAAISFVYILFVGATIFAPASGDQILKSSRVLWQSS